MNPLTVHELLEKSAARLPEKVAFVQGGERFSYHQLNARANHLSAFLRQQGVAPGDRVVFLFRNGIEYAASYYGILKAGAVAVPLNSEIRPETLASVLAELRPRVAVCGGEEERLIRGIDTDAVGIETLLARAPSLSWCSRRLQVVGWDEVVRDEPLADPGLPVAPGELASIIYTSGSTGKPKGVMLSHRNIVCNTCSIVQYLELTADDVQMVVLPFFYVMGKSLLNTHVAVGGTVVVNNDFAYTAPVIKQMAAEGVTGFSGVPSTYAYLLHRSPLASYRDKLERLRYCTQAGGHMARELKERLLQALPPHTRLYVMYGATEAAARLTYVEPERLPAKLDSIGRPIPGVTVRVLDPAGRELPDGEHGELVASGDNIMLGYWGDPEGSARVLDANGYHTGDLGFRDPDGYLYVTGRRDDLLKVGGHRVDPQEVEDTLIASGELLEVAVVGVDDPMLGKKLVAVAVPLSPEVTEKPLLSYCLEKLPRHKVPSHIGFVRSLPKSPSGKVDRAACLAAALRESGAGGEGGLTAGPEQNREGR